MKQRFFWAAGALAIAGCAIAGCAHVSPVTEAGNGVYVISVAAGDLAGGATAAYARAFGDAQNFCALRGDRLHAVILDTQGSATRAELRFRCDRLK